MPAIVVNRHCRCRPSSLLVGPSSELIANRYHELRDQRRQQQQQRCRAADDLTLPDLQSSPDQNPTVLLLCRSTRFVVPCRLRPCRHVPASVPTSIELHCSIRWTSLSHCSMRLNTSSPIIARASHFRHGTLRDLLYAHTHTLRSGRRLFFFLVYRC